MGAPTHRGLPSLFIPFRSEGNYSSFSKASLSNPQTGQTKSSGRSSQAVPGSMPLSGSPRAGSYSYPQGQTYFIILIPFVFVKFSMAEFRQFYFMLRGEGWDRTTPHSRLASPYAGQGFAPAALRMYGSFWES